MGDIQWWYGVQGKQLGPVGTVQLRQMLVQGTLKSSDYVWREGFAAWTEVAKVPELTGAANGTPAPAPAAGAPPGGKPTTEETLNMIVLTKAERWSELVATTDQLLRTRGPSAEIYQFRTLALMNLKQFEPALKESDVWLHYSPNEHSAHLLRANARLQLSQGWFNSSAGEHLRHALVDVNRALAIKPDNQSSLALKAAILLQGASHGIVDTPV